MSYITGTITSANPSADLYAAIAPALTSAGFTLEDTVVLTTNTFKVWKSAAANNAEAKDWYLVLRYFTTGSGRMSWFFLEDYTAGTDLGFRGAKYMLSTTAFTTTGPNHGPWGDTGQALTYWNGVSDANTSVTSHLNTVTSAFGYWISVTGDRIIGMVSSSPSDVLYSGFYDIDAAYATLIGAARFPLVQGTFGAPTNPSFSTLVMLSRYPNGLSGYQLYNSPIPAVYLASPYLSLAGALQIPAQTSTFMAARGGVRGPIYGASGFFGHYKDLLWFEAAATVARGDTLTIAGDTWVLCTVFDTDKAIAFRAV